jgi:hypothetical protein
MDKLTRTILVNLLCRDGNDAKKFNQDLDNNVGHPYGHWELDINLQPHEDDFDTFEQFQCTSSSAYGVSDLRDYAVTKGWFKGYNKNTR